MSHKVTFTFEMTDAEHAAFIANLSARGTVVPTDDDDTAGPGETVNTSGADTFGVPYNPAFHAKAKTTNADGSWRRSKGMSAEQKAAADAYEAPFKAAPTNTQPPVAGMPGLGAAMPAPVAMPGIPAALPLPVVPVVAPVIDYESLVAKLTTKMQAGTITSEMIAGLYAAAGLTDVNALITDETLRSKLDAEINKY